MPRAASKSKGSAGGLPSVKRSLFDSAATEVHDTPEADPLLGGSAAAQFALWESKMKQKSQPIEIGEDDQGPTFVFPLADWRNLEVNRWAPSAREGHSAHVIGTSMFVFGGMENTTRSNTFLSFDLEKKSWRNVTEISGNLPEARSYHASCTWGHRMFIHGGEGSASITGGSPSPRKLRGPLSRFENIPKEETFDALSFTNPEDEDQVTLTLSNGLPPCHYLGDLHIYDSRQSKWSRLYPDVCPPSCKSHTLVALYVGPFDTASTSPSDKLLPHLVLFGGTSHYKHFPSDQLLMLNINTLDQEGSSWFAPTAHGVAPCGRSGHSCTVLSRTAFAVFGGIDDRKRLLNDLVIYDTIGHLWTQLGETIGMGPAPCRGHSACAFTKTTSTNLEPEDEMSLKELGSDFGSWDPDMRFLVYGGVSIERMGSEAPRESFIYDSYLLDLSSKQWLQLSNGPTFPNARRGHTMGFIAGWQPSWFEKSNWGFRARGAAFAKTLPIAERIDDIFPSDDENFPLLGVMYGGLNSMFCSSDIWLLDLKPFVTAKLDMLENETASRAQKHPPGVSMTMANTAFSDPFSPGDRFPFDPSAMTIRQNDEIQMALETQQQIRRLSENERDALRQKLGQERDSAREIKSALERRCMELESQVSQAQSKSADLEHKVGSLEESIAVETEKTKAAEEEADRARKSSGPSVFHMQEPEATGQASQAEGSSDQVLPGTFAENLKQIWDTDTLVRMLRSAVFQKAFSRMSPDAANTLPMGDFSAEYMTHFHATMHELLLWDLGSNSQPASQKSQSSLQQLATQENLFRGTHLGLAREGSGQTEHLALSPDGRYVDAGTQSYPAAPSSDEDTFRLAWSKFSDYVTAEGGVANIFKDRKTFNKRDFIAKLTSADIGLSEKQKLLIAATFFPRTRKSGDSLALLMDADKISQTFEQIKPHLLSMGAASLAINASKAAIAGLGGAEDGEGEIDDKGNENEVEENAGDEEDDEGDDDEDEEGEEEDDDGDGDKYKDRKETNKARSPAKGNDEALRPRPMPIFRRVDSSQLSNIYEQAARQSGMLAKPSPTQEAAGGDKDKQKQKEAEAEQAIKTQKPKKKRT